MKSSNNKAKEIQKVMKLLMQMMFKDEKEK